MKDTIFNGKWNINLLNSMGLGDFINSIINVPLSVSSDIHDKLVWSFQTNGIYSTASTYNWLIVELLLLRSVWDGSGFGAYRFLNPEQRLALKCF